MTHDHVMAQTARPASTGDRTRDAARHHEARRAPPPVLLPSVAAKISRPQMLRNGIRRQRLLDRLDAAAHCPVVLVCAGAGWGKTVLVSSWAETRNASVGWLALDEQDDDVAGDPADGGG